MVRVCRTVPKDWSRYSPIGNVIPRTRFIVFKTPLNQRLNGQLPREQRFTVSDLFRTLALRNQRLGLVVDLTDTDRYYDKEDVLGMLVDYEKIYCPGRHFVDRDEIVDSFNQAIQNYIDQCTDEEALIGIHCTHGVNRSGYLICRFLIERLGWSSHEALDAFEHARGYPIEKGGYVMALHKAAKDARNRKAGSESDSSEKKHKKRSKRKNRGDDIPVNDMLSAFLGELDQQAQQIGAASGLSGSPNFNGVNGKYEEVTVEQTQHWAYVNKKSKFQSLAQVQVTSQVTSQQSSNSNAGSQQDGSPFVDDEEQEEGGEEDYEYDVVEGGQTVSTASKRRRRRNRTQKMLNVMKRGRFHEIQEMQKEFANTFGAVANAQ